MNTIDKIIENELKKLSYKERETFRGDILSTFNALYKNINERMTNFENKILDTSLQRNDEIHIINMLVPKDEYYLYEEQFSPIKLEDNINNPLITLLQNKDIETDKEPIVYDKIVYVKEKDDMLKYSGYLFEGESYIDGKMYKFKLRLEKDDSYKQKIEELYHTFQLNFLKWTTLNVPYASRVFKIIITEYDNTIIEALNKLPDRDKISNIDILDENIKRDFAIKHIPVWNMIHTFKYSNGTIEPTENRINYTHTVKSNNDHELYLVPIQDVHVYSIGKISEGYKIITDTNKAMSWDFISIPNITKLDYDKRLEFPVFTNNEIDLFINKLKYMNKIRIRTEAEIHRVVNSYKNIRERFKLINIEVTDKIKDSRGTEDLDYFIIDEFKMKKDTKFMYLYFETVKKDQFLDEELSFIISLMQPYFPEYQCKGILL